MKDFAANFMENITGAGELTLPAPLGMKHGTPPAGGISARARRGFELQWRDDELREEET